MAPDVTLAAAIKRTSRRRFLWILTVAVLLTSGMGIVLWIGARQADRDADHMRQTRAVKQALDNTIRHLIDVQRGARGFSLTGEDHFLETLAAGRELLPQDMATLRRLTAGPLRAATVDALEPQIDSALEFADALVASRKNTGAIPDIRVVRENNRLGNAARAAIRRMQAEEDRLMMERNLESDGARRTTTAVVLVGGLVGLILVSGIGYAVYRELGTTVPSGEIERRMEQRTAALSVERDERDARPRRVQELNEQAALLDEAYDPVLVWNLENGEITYCNTAAEQLYGFKRTEAIGRRIHELLVTSFPRRDDVLAALRDSGRWEGTVTHTTKDDRQIIVDTRMVAFQTAGGTIRVLQANRDVTEQKQIEQALRASESQFRQLAEATPAMIWQVAPDGSITYLNQRLRDYLGWETVGLEDWREAVHPDDRLRAVTFRDSVQASRRFVSDEFRLRRHDGDYRWFCVQRAAVLNSDGTPACWIGAATDIDELRRAQQALVETNQRKDEFLATLAHELRNPLAPIRFALDGLKAEVPASELEHARDVIERQVTQLVRLVDDLLDASRITTNKIRLRRAPVRLAELMEVAVQGASPLAHASDHQLDVELPPPTVWIDGDAARLIQVFANVLNNAVKFTPRGGRISFTAAAGDHEAIVRVRDSGVGIAPDALPHLFEMFHQEGNNLERSTGGLGIGLTLAHRLTEMHDGRIEVRSAGVGKGTEVEIRLPTTVARDTPAGEAERGLGAQANRHLRVEIVDDNVDAAEMLGALVSGLGHTTELAHDGPSALQVAETFVPDVILLDIGLPIMNGYAVAQELRRRPALRSVHLAAVTGWGQAEDRRRAREAGFDTHLTKPVATTTVEELLSAIARGEQDAGQANSRQRTRLGDTASRM